MKDLVASLQQLYGIGSHEENQFQMLVSDVDEGRFDVTATHLVLHAKDFQYNV